MITKESFVLGIMPCFHGLPIYVKGFKGFEAKQDSN
jgi:hypothetical protein